MDLYLDGDSDEDVSAMNPDDDEYLRRTEEADERDHSGDSGGEQMSKATGPIERTQVAVPVACVKKTKRQKQMSKTERQRLMTQIRQVDRNKLFVEAEEQLSKQLHFSVFEERGKFFTTLFTSHKSEVSQLCDALVGEFCSIYESCATGKEKCSRFHMQWHSYCSTFLIEPTSSSERSCQSTSVKLWTTLSSGIRKEVKKTQSSFLSALLCATCCLLKYEPSYRGCSVKTLVSHANPSVLNLRKCTIDSVVLQWQVCTRNDTK